MGTVARRVPGLANLASAFVRPKILDRYVVAELSGPFAFGLSAFTLMFAATNVLAISRLVGEEHAPFGAAVAYFLWQMPEIVVTVVPMGMLLGTLLALQRLSAESEITALKAGGIGLVRAVAPLLVVGFIVSILAYALQETIVPLANERATYLRDDAIRHIGAFGGGSRTVVSDLPGGGQQVTYFRGYDPKTQSLLNVTIITYGADRRPTGILFSDRGRYVMPTWTFENATEYHFAGDGSTESRQDPSVTIDVGQKPNQIQQRAMDTNRESMSRAQIHEIIDSGQLTQQETRAYRSTYEEKLARPFATFVFALIAIPFALRPPRGGGGVGAGFGLAIPIAFLYFVMASASSAFFSGLGGGYVVASVGAWLPNVIFTAIGAERLRRAANY